MVRVNGLVIRQGYIHQTFRAPLGSSAKATIGDQLQTYRSTLTEAQDKGDQAIARKLKEQIKDLEEFQQRHPEETEAPSPFEVFCDLNPSDVNCRIYDD
jgi:CP12 domain